MRLQRRRLTLLAASQWERDLRCVRCGTLERVFEAASGARTPGEHQWIDPAAFLCWSCMEDEA